MTSHVYPPSPEVQARNDARRAVLALVDSLVVSGLHGQRARVRVAALCPPPAVAPVELVRQAVADTAPDPAALELLAGDAMALSR